MSDKSFSILALSSAMLANLESLDYREMTEIQAKSLPVILAGQDIIAKAKTGSGKTAAFGIGLLERLQVQRFRIQALVLCPTRELAEQVAIELRRLARFTHNIKILTLCGGTSIGPQIGSLEHGAHIIVGTPGRIGDHLRKQTLLLNDVHTVVLDEADRMLDMGFSEEIEVILQECPRERQTLLFSATYPERIQQISSAYQNNAVEVSVDAVHEASVIEQHFVELAGNDEKPGALIKLLVHFQPESALVFCNTKIACDEVTAFLQDNNINALALHGDMEQRDRNQVLLRFSNKSCRVLVATDVAARGLDIKELAAVISYDVTPDPDTHLHRIGRTGRAGESGLAIALVTSREIKRVNAIEEAAQKELQWLDISGISIPVDFSLPPAMVTLDIDGGKKQKIRKGDVLGALTATGGVDAASIGKIDITDFHCYVAIERKAVNKALAQLQNGKIKGKNFRVRKL